MTSKSLLTGALAGLTLAGSALAADLPVRAPPPYAPPLFTWTGFYVGVNGGVDFNRVAVSRIGSARWRTSGFASDIANSNFFQGVNPNLNGTGAAGGVQIGYNYQINQIVVGAEADIDALSARKSSIIGPTAVVGGNPQTLVQSARTTYLATVRARLGLAVDRWLVFVTGGVAFGDNKFSGSVIFNNTVPIYTGSVSRTRTGYALGGGVEYAVTNNWTVKAEYIYANLGTTSFIGAGPNAVAGYTITHRARLQENLVRVGINYKF